MQSASAVLVLLALVAFAPANAVETNPIQKILEMLGDLETKVIADGKAAEEEYTEYSEWCEDTSKNLQYEIKTGKATKADLEATIAKMTAQIEADDTKIGELVASIASAEKDMAEATEVRDTEAADFAALKKELTETISMMERAIGILEKEMAKSGASMLQYQGADSVTKALNLMVQASLFSSADASKLTAFVQSTQESEDSDANTELGAPAAAVYEGKGGGIIDVLSSMLDKATAQLDAATKKEESAIQNFEMLSQSLADEIKFAKQDKAAAEASKEECAETKSTSEGDLSVTTSDLMEDEKSLAGTHSECMTAANDFEAETMGRAEELKALATAKKVISEATGGAEAHQYSFVQVSSSTRLSTRADLASFEVVRSIRELAKKTNSRALAQLASKMNSAVRLGGSESDVFAKIKGMINDMIAKLQKEAESAAGEKEYCDKETSETTAKKEDNAAEIKKLSVKIDQAAAKSAKLKEEVAVIQKELADLAKSQADMNEIRLEEKTTFDKTSADLKQGIEGLQMALKVLTDFYSKDSAHGSSEGAGGGIISLLEVAESDFSKELSEITAIESQAVAAHDKQTKENDLTKTMKSQDEKYKTKEFTSLDKTIEELTSDREGVQTEQDATLEYLGKINERCIAKPEPYAEIKARREAEIEGLKEGLEILESETVLIQKVSKRTLRGVHIHSM